MKAGWQVKKLGEVCEILDSKRIPITKKDRIAGEYPYYGATGILDYVQEYIFDEKLILVGEDGAKWGAGEKSAFIAEGRYWVNNHAHVLRPCRNVLIDNWIVYYLNQADLSGYISGLTVPKLNQEKLKEIVFPLPPLTEQQRIVAILDEAFESIATAKASAEQNLKNARELFDSYLQSVFTQRGEGWVEKRLAEICILRSGTTLSPKIEKEIGEVPYLKVADMNIGENISGVTTSSRFVDSCDVNKSNLMPIGTTIFPKRGGAILTNKKRLTKRVICADLNIMGVTPKAGLLPEFLYAYFIGLDLRKINNGSSIPQINNYSIEPLLISFPTSLTDQRSIVARLDAFFAETQRLEAIYKQKIAALDELKQSLLQKAFAGEL